MKKATLMDVAREAGVSRAAVGRVLLGTGGDGVRVSEGTKKRIEEAAAKLAYFPNRSAQQLRGKASRVMGVILDTRNTPVMSERLFSLEKEASKLGYRLLVGHVHGNSSTLGEYVKDFCGWGAEAILCLFDLAPGRDERAGENFGRFRNIVFHGRPAWRGGYCVRVDTAAAVSMAVDHLVQRGKKRLGIALWNCAEDELMEVRRVAFLDRAAFHGKQAIVWDAAAEAHDETSNIQDFGIDYLVSKMKADAILASNDIWATRFILHLQKRGIDIPRQVAVIGYDNLDVSRVISPALTTVDQEHGEYARQAMELLVALSTGRRVREKTVTIRPALIVRHST